MFYWSDTLFVWVLEDWQLLLQNRLWFYANRFCIVWRYFPNVKKHECLGHYFSPHFNIHSTLTARYVIQIIDIWDGLYCQDTVCLFFTVGELYSFVAATCWFVRPLGAGAGRGCTSKNAINAFSLQHNNRISSTGAFVTALQFIIMNDPCFKDTFSFTEKDMMKIRDQLTWKWIMMSFLQV